LPDSWQRPQLSQPARIRTWGEEPSAAFDHWLQETLVAVSPAERITRLVDWEAAPAASKVHPQEDRLLPLMVVVGAAENDKAMRVYHEDDFFRGIAVSSFMFGVA